MKKQLFLALLFCIPLSASAADSFSTLEERMSGREFRETGLEKLTEEELAALNAWLRSHSVATLENAVQQAGARDGSVTDDRGFENRKGSPDTPYDKVINSSIVGSFSGWSGDKTEFKLANGMVWVQAEGDTFHIKTLQNPEVIIEKGFMDSWRLRVAGYNNTVRVRRVK